LPLNSTQLAALVERARQKPPPAVSPPPSPMPATLPRRAVRLRQAGSAPPAPSPARPAPGSGTLTLQQQAEVAAPTAPPPPLPSPAPLAEPEAEEFPIGWELRKESWRFHRRFYAVLHRPMALGEYSHLLWQIRRGKAEHLSEDCWRVTLPNGRTLPVRGNRWKLITILPKDWQPPARAE
jgi:hypothetical protein